MTASPTRMHPVQAAPRQRTASGCATCPNRDVPRAGSAQRNNNVPPDGSLTTGRHFFTFPPSRSPTVAPSSSVTMYNPAPHLLDRSSMAKQNLSHRANVICDGSPSRIRMVRRISLGITTRPRSSMRRTIPVAFIYKFPPVKADFSLVVSAAAGVLCTGSFFHNTADFAL